MNCPNCGTPILNDQQFCRSCGAPLAAAGPRRFDPRLAGLTMAFGGILIALAGSFVELRAVLFLGVIISIAGMFFIAAYPMLRSSLNRSSVAPDQPESLPPAPTTKKLEPIGDFEYVPASVTERTTNLLKEPAAKRNDTDN
jgi:hypothetical protein